MKTNIYALVDPRTDEIRYIGKTNDIEQRLKNHLNPARYRPTHKFNWIRKLRRLNMKPYLIILDEVPINDWKFWEKFWIQLIKSWDFNLVNHTEGGDGLTYGNQTSFKKGHKSWNTGKGYIKTCEICGKNFQSCITAKKRSCSKTCEKIIRQNVDSITRFKKNQKPWNFEKKGHFLTGKKLAKEVTQLDKNTEKIINNYRSCKEAAEAMNCIPENIRRACVGKTKTAKGYKWKYNDK